MSRSRTSRHSLTTLTSRAMMTHWTKVEESFGYFHKMKKRQTTMRRMTSNTPIAIHCRLSAHGSRRCNSVHSTVKTNNRSFLSPLDMCITFAIFFMTLSIFDSLVSISCAKSSSILQTPAKTQTCAVEGLQVFGRCLKLRLTLAARPTRCRSATTRS